MSNSERFREEASNSKIICAICGQQFFTSQGWRVMSRDFEELDYRETALGELIL